MIRLPWRRHSVYWSVTCTSPEGRPTPPVVVTDPDRVQKVAWSGVQAMMDLDMLDTGRVTLYSHHDHQPGQACPALPVDTTGQDHCPMVCHYEEVLQIVKARHPL